MKTPSLGKGAMGDQAEDNVAVKEVVGFGRSIVYSTLNMVCEKEKVPSDLVFEGCHFFKLLPAERPVWQLALSPVSCVANGDSPFPRKEYLM